MIDSLFGIALSVSFLALALGMILALFRLVKGPTNADRILALDTLVINVLGVIILMGIALGFQIYFEVSMLVAMVGFVSTVALARFILRGDIIE